MKKIHYILFTILVMTFSGCEQVIDVDLETAAPRLVIDASIQWQKGTNGETQKVKLTTTAPYFGTEIPTVSNATVFITDSNNTIFNFIETPDTGEYYCTDFVPVLNTSYVLTVITNGETYTATETFKPVPVIDKVEQIVKEGFSGEYTQIKAFYTDDAATNDFYLFRWKPNFKAIPSYSISEDEFYQGNQIFGLYISEDFKPGDKIDITIYGISERYYNYMNKLISIVETGGPFQSPPSKVLGNIVNTTNKDNYALGYFNLSEIDFLNYEVVEE